MILLYAETENGNFKKSALELLSFAQTFQPKEKIIAVTINANTEVSALENYGATTIISVTNEKLDFFSAKAYASVLKQVAEKYEVQTILLSTSSNAKYIAPLLAIDFNAVYLPNIASEETENGFKKAVFSSKATAFVKTENQKKILSVQPNIFSVKEQKGSSEVINFTPVLSDDLFGVKLVKEEKHNKKVAIADASIVVSGGRGLQSPENWYLIEELAEVLGAATACTKPVSDMGWRPHSEHVGQTGKPVGCDLYIAVGISGAIQHIAGINASKIKVVINSDPEAPFFKVADYGIVGDAFEILPKLTQKIKERKTTNK